MKVLAYGDIMDKGKSAFTSIAKIDGRKLLVSFAGVIRIDSPYRHLENYLKELETMLPAFEIDDIQLDFMDLSFCNSNGFYVIMDITELVINQFDCPVTVKRLKDDDWHQETLPILLNTDEPTIQSRTTFEEIEAI